MSNKVKLHRMFFGIFGQFDDFCRALEKCTQNYEVICLDNTQASNRLQDCVFYYKAALEVPDFKLCAQVFYKLCERYARESSSSSSSQPLLGPMQDQAEDGGGGRWRRGRGICNVVKEQEQE